MNTTSIPNPKAVLNCIQKLKEDLIPIMKGQAY